MSLCNLDSWSFLVGFLTAYLTSAIVLLLCVEIKPNTESKE